MVPAESLYAELLASAGFVNVQVEPIRKRNSKRELYEFAVEADYMKASDLGTVAAVPPMGTPRLFR